jgi:hypothetical protein
MYYVNSKKKDGYQVDLPNCWSCSYVGENDMLLFLFIDKLKHVMLKLITNNQALPSFMES